MRVQLPLLPLLMLTLAVCLRAPAEAQNLSGTWRLDASQSEVHEDVGFAALVAAGVPETLHVTHPANGTLVVESQVNESHARLYVPGRETDTPVFLGAAGSVSVTSRWEGASLIAEGTRTFSSGGATPVTIRESFRLSDDESTLVLSIDVGPAKSELRYQRIDDVGTCESWPSPCKKYSP